MSEIQRKQNRNFKFSISKRQRKKRKTLGNYLEKSLINSKEDRQNRSNQEP